MSKSTFIMLILIAMMVSACTNDNASIKIQNQPQPEVAHSINNASLMDINFTSLMIKVEGCGSRCPIYALHVLKNGDANFQGVAFVAVVGEKKLQLSDKQLEEVRELLIEVSQTSHCKVENSDINIIRVNWTVETSQYSKSLNSDCHKKTFAKIEIWLNKNLQSLISNSFES